MTDDEANELSATLTDILRSRGLSWLAEEIAGEIAEGKASRKMLTVQEYGDTSTEDISHRAKRRTEFTHVRALTPKEKIEVSLKALRAIVVSSAEILPEVTRTLDFPKAATISFVSETDAAPTVLHENDPGRFSSAARELDELLSRLDREVHDSAS
jgi:hypothetical protein